MLRLASLIAFSLFTSAIAGQAPPKPGSGSAQTTSRPSKETASGRDGQARTLQQQRLENLTRVHGFAEHVQEFKNLTARVRGLIGLADALWKEDEPYARKLFATAYEAAGVNMPTAGAAEDSGDKDSAAADFGWLRREVVARIARHDPRWAKDLTQKEASTSKSESAYLQMAGALVADDPKQASQYLEMGLNSDPNQNIATLLDELRRKEPAAADALFVKSLQGLAAEPIVQANQLLQVGYYVLLPDPDARVVVVRGNLIFNFSELNPLASTAAITAFLDIAVDILSRPVPPSLDQRWAPPFKEGNYIAACLLLPKVTQFVPERAAQLEAAMRDLALDGSTGLTEDAIRATINAAHPARVNTLEEARTDLDGIRDDARRDSRCIELSYSFFLKGDFHTARAIVGEVKDLQVREKLLLLLGFEEGAKLLDGGKLNEAMAVATKLLPGIERAVLWLGIAHKQIERGDTKLASTTINWSLTEANRLQNPRRAVLILRAARDLAGFDPVLASQTMNEAVRAFNNVSPYSPLKMLWSEPVSARPPYITFPLQVGGLDFQLARMLGPLGKMDMEGTIYDVMSLEDEEARGQALAVLASLILEKKGSN